MISFYYAGTGPSKKPKRITHVSHNESVCQQAKKKGPAGKINERKPIYIHWFGLEMLNAYESAKSKVENKDSPVGITLGESTYEIEGIPCKKS